MFDRIGISRSIVAVDIRCLALMLLGTLTLRVWLPTGVGLDWPAWVNLGLGLVALPMMLWRSRWRYLGWFLLVLVGMTWRVSLLNTQVLPAALEGRHLLVTACIEGVPLLRAQSTRMDARLRSPASVDGLLARLSVYRQPIDVHAGECWQMTLKMKRAHGYANPGGFDYERWLFARGVAATAYVKKPQTMVRVRGLESRSFVGLKTLRSLRQQWLGSLRKATESLPFSGVLLAITMGDRERISAEQWQVFRNTGTSHLVAISGLHISLISGLVYVISTALIGFMSRRFVIGFQPLFGKRLAISMGMFAALAYAFLADFSLPTVRATILVAVMSVGFMFRRPVQASRSLAWALILILLFDPLAVLSAGFWLSFSAVAAILWLLPQDRRLQQSDPRRLSKVRRSLWHWSRLQLGIALGLAPLTLLWFQQASLLAPLANLLAIPLFSLLIIPLALLSAIVLLISPMVGSWLLGITDALLGLMWMPLSSMSQLAWVNWLTPDLPWLTWLLLAVGALLLTAPGGFPGRWLGVLMWLPALMHQPDRPQYGQAEFTLLDVGQGLSAVIQTQNKTLLFDAGPVYRSGFNTGDSVVLPFLRSRGIHTLDRMIISHGDSDHVGGAPAILKALRVERVDSGEPLPLKAPSERCIAGQRWSWDGVDFEFLWPSLQNESIQNNRSCVLRVEANGQVLLLTGDIEADAEDRLMAMHAVIDAHEPDPLQADVMVAPHHGSKTSSSLAFIARIKPRWVLFPLGYQNRYHFPSNKVTRRYRQAGVAMRDTASNGAIRVLLGASDGMLSPLSYRQQNPRWWRQTCCRP